MINFFTKFLTPVFILLGLINTPVENPEFIQPNIQQEIVEISQENEVSEIEEIIENVQEVSIYTAPTIENNVVEEAIEPIAEIVVEIENPICGDSHDSKSYETPIEELCEVGEASIVINDEETFTWSCINQELSINCSSLKRIDGECGFDRNDSIPVDYEREQLCSGGESKSISSSGGDISWSCNGINEGKNRNSCSALLSKHAECGYTANTCKVGSVTYSNIVNNSQTWGCAGVNNGNDINCSAYINTNTNTSGSGGGSSQNPYEVPSECAHLEGYSQLLCIAGEVSA